jgi:hypothetical protein
MVVAPSPEIRAEEYSANVTLKANVVSLPSVFTLRPIGVGTNRATLCGWLVDLGTARNMSVNFGWDTVSHAGNPSAYRNWTAPRILTRPGLFSTPVSGLAPGHFYFFRAKAVGDAVNYGDEICFLTNPGRPWQPWEWWYWFFWYQ